MLSPKESRCLQVAIAVPTVIALLFQCDIYDLSFFAPMLLLPCWLGAFLCASGLFLEALITRVRKGLAPHLWTACLLAIAVGPGIPFLLAPFLWISASHKLLRHRSDYLQAVAVADATGDSSKMYLTEAGPPPFYYFVWSGFADNSWGIVHDRSQTFSDADPETTFGGYFVRNMHLWGPWYFLQLT